MVIFTIGFIIIILLAYYNYKKIYCYWDKHEITYYRKYSLFLGIKQLVFPSRNHIYELMALYNTDKNKQIYGIFLFCIPQLMIKDPDLIKLICTKDFEHFTDRFDGFAKHDKLFSKSLFHLRAKKWNTMRKTLSPIFNGNKLRNLCELLSKYGNNMSVHYQNKCNDQNCDILKIHFNDACARFANDAITETVFGITINSLKNPNNEYFRNVALLQKFPICRILILSFFPFIKKVFDLQFLPGQIYDFFEKTVSKSIETRQTQENLQGNLVHHLLEFRTVKNKSSDSLDTTILTNQDITSQSFVFYLAGLGNVAMIMSFTAYELAINPEFQNKLFSEIKMTLEQNNGTLDYDVLKTMKYLNMVVLESLRKWPVVTFVERVCTKPYFLKTNGNTIYIEVGTKICIPIMAVHHDPKFFPNPEVFEPERFNAINRKSIRDYTYIPFGTGPRACIASNFVVMEMKLFLVHLIKTFEVIVTDKTPIPMKLEPGLVLKPEGNEFGLGLKLRK